MKKTLTTLTILATLLLGSFAVAQSSWIGTDWIQAGNTVSSVNLKSNLDYLYNEKAPIPQDCNGITEFLGWFNGGWTCRGSGVPAGCAFNGTSVSHGDTVTAYESTTVAAGSACVSEVRTCSNGTLSGSYQAASCSVAAASSCVLNGSVIQHGDTVTAYESTTVGAGSACVSEVRTCSNGTLSGSYQNTTCTVAPTACVFGGTEIAEGASVQGFFSQEVPFGSSCTSEIRNCTDGNLTGTAQHDSCTVVAPAAYGQCGSAHNNWNETLVNNAPNASTLCAVGNASGLNQVSGDSGWLNYRNPAWLWTCGSGDFAASCQSNELCLFGNEPDGSCTQLNLWPSEISPSDKNLKTNITLLYTHEDINVYSFEYKTNPGVVYQGVLAQEIVATHPQAVVRQENGYLAVDYAQIPVSFKQVTK